MVCLKIRQLLPLFLLVSVVAPVAVAHEFWIEPTQYQVEPQSTMEAFLRNGERFAGSTQSYYKGSTNRFELFSHGDVETITPRLGDNPALALEARRDGLHVVVHQSPVSTLTYNKWEKFQRFADHKDFKDVLARHQARRLSEQQFIEAYSRYSKSLIAVGDGAGSDQKSGLEIELVALQNPYTGDISEGMKVAGYYQEEVRPDAQIELFEKTPDGDVMISLHRTDNQGIVILPVKSKHSYLVDMVVLREPSKALAKEKNVVWETLWASLTFEVR